MKSCLPISRCAAACMASPSSGRGTRQARFEIERQIGAAVDDPIEIMALDRREARIEIGRHLFRREHGDRLRPQMEIDRVAHIIGVPILGKIDMGDLAERMHAGIGAPGAEHGDAFAGKSRDRFGQHALHRDAVVLCLPADKRRAVIFDGELVAGHGNFAAHLPKAPRQHATCCRARPACRAEIPPPASACRRRAAVRPSAARRSPQATVKLLVEHAARLARAARLWSCATP